MKQQVWKFKVSTEVTLVELPRGAKVVHVGMQDGRVCFWALVTPIAVKQPRHFVVRGTGWEVPSGAIYCGTTQDGPYVWHVFEVS